MDYNEAVDRLDDDIDAAVARAERAGMTFKEIAERLRDIAHNIESYPSDT